MFFVVRVTGGCGKVWGCGYCKMQPELRGRCFLSLPAGVLQVHRRNLKKRLQRCLIGKLTPLFSLNPTIACIFFHLKLYIRKATAVLPQLVLLQKRKLLLLRFLSPMVAMLRSEAEKGDNRTHFNLINWAQSPRFLISFEPWLLTLHSVLSVAASEACKRTQRLQIVCTDR